MLLEIATTDYESTRAAIAGGAGRIELCCALGDRGLTPSAALIRQCRQDFPKAVLFPIIRPRGGDFLYTDPEKDIILSDIAFCRSMGVQGIVTGALLADGSIDLPFLKELVKLAKPMEVTFHRAFDRCRDPLEALEQIIEAGCTRLLTSGQKPAAIQGTALIKALIDKAAGRIIIMPGSGVRADNIRALKAATGATEFHSSAKSTQVSRMSFVHPEFGEEDFNYPGIQAADVKALRDALAE